MSSNNHINFELLTFATGEELAWSAAQQWLAKLSSSPKASVALSGGRIARQFFSAIAAHTDAAQKLAQVDFFWADERCVPPDDPESNFGIAQELLFSPLHIANNRIHRIRGEVAPDEAAKQAESELRQVTGAKPGDQPIIDLIFLGMGEDGHTASLFPGEREEMRGDPAVYRHVVAVKTPPHRITLGYQTIIAARDAWVLVSAAGKENALRQSFQPAATTPLGFVIHNRQSTRIFSDVKV